MSNITEIPLTEIGEWPQESVQKMAANWITTVEQVVAICASREGGQAMAEQLGITSERLQELVQAARRRLAPEVAQALEQHIDPSQYSLGARKPLNIKRDT